jgi:hypothetical protein
LGRLPARLNEFIVAEEFRRGGLVPVLVDYHYAEAEPMLAMYPHMRHRLPRVAAMLEFMAETFVHSPWRPVLPRTPNDVKPAPPERSSSFAGAEPHP